MIKKYNLALIPTTQNTTFLKLAHKFRSVSDQYILGENSLPHITLRQFHADPNVIDTIWREAWMMVPQSLKLRLESFSFTTSNQVVYWLALMPNQRELLFKLHQKISSMLDMTFNENYDPHLTLCNTRVSNCESLMDVEKNQFKVITDHFRLGLGDCDPIGQYLTSIITTPA